MKARAAPPLRYLAAPVACLAGCCTASRTPRAPASPRTSRAIIFLQRVARNDGVGNVFDYTSYEPGARLVKLEPPSADGKLHHADPRPACSPRLRHHVVGPVVRRQAPSCCRRGCKGDAHYQLFVMNVDGSEPAPDHRGALRLRLPGLPARPARPVHDHASRSRQGAQQFQDEYERQTTAQVGTINVDGSGETLGPRNVSHRVAPALLPDGNVLYTEWRHLGDINDGHLRLMNTDMTGMREAFGGEGRGITNSYLKARYVDTRKGAAGRDTYRVVTVGDLARQHPAGGQAAAGRPARGRALGRGHRPDPPGAGRPHPLGRRHRPLLRRRADRRPARS